ncbi:MAG: hypothetical protein Q8P41_00865 [Pseudomonadota bacterium]|nr:hypothetical protein [Pseudomonadota bacterium]
MLVSLVIATLLGCAGECTSATCLADAAVKDWAADPSVVTARIIALEDDIARTVVVGRLCEAFPGQTGALCAALPDGASRQRCERLNGRPHLSFDPTHLATTAPASGGVPADGGAAARLPTHTNPPGLPTDVLQLVAAAAPPALCETENDRAACIDAKALEAALARQYAAAGGICVLHGETRWVDECRFHAAEQAVRAQHEDAYAGAVALCGAATSFTQECWVHVLTRLPKRVPPPDAGAVRAKDAVELAATVRTAWAPAGGDVAARHVDRFWAIYFANVYRQTEMPDGTPLAFYPEEAWPHVRAAAAMRMREVGRLSGSLAAQVGQLQETLAARHGGTSRRGRPPDLVYVEDVGAPVTDGPTTFFLGASRRPLGADAQADATFCVLEAAGRGRPPDLEVLDEAARSPDPSVSGEARRILRALAESSAGAPTAVGGAPAGPARATTPG